MSSWRVALPALVGLGSAVLFGLLRPELTDRYSSDLSIGLQWPLVIAALAAFAATRDYQVTGRAKLERVTGPIAVATVVAIAVAVLWRSVGPDWRLDLHWASLGLVLGALGAVLATADYANGTPFKITKSLGGAMAGALGIGLLSLLVWRAASDGWKWMPAIVLLACAVVLLGTVPRVAWKSTVGAAPDARPFLIRGIAFAFVAVIAILCLLFPEEVDRLASTVFAVVLAVSMIGLLWIFMNVLVENARNNWALFSATAAAIVAALAFAILRGNISLKTLIVEEDPLIFGAGSGFWGHVEWPLFGALFWGIGVFVLRQFSSRIPRVAIGAALGAVTGWLIGDNSLLWQRPAIPWGQTLLFTAVFAIIGAAWRMRRKGKAPQPLAFRDTSAWSYFTTAVGPLALVVTILAFTGSISVPMWITGLAILLGLYLALPFASLAHRAGTQVISGAGTPGALSWAIPGALTGAVVGFTFSAWLRSDFFGTNTDVIIAAAIPLALLGIRIAWNNDPDPSALSAFENRSHAVIFLGPALLFLSSALVIPAIRTIILSTLDRNFASRNFTGNTFDGFQAQGDAFVGFDNYRELVNDVDTFDFSNWSNLFGSDLFYIALILGAVGLIAGLISGTKQNGTASYVGTGSSVGSIALGALLLSFAVLAVLRGTFFNNLWWVITVTSLSVTFGLTIAVLSERAGRLESVAKSLIFMPMAISFVGASIVWRLQYQPRDVSKPQTGVLNAAWVKLGQLSHAGWPRTLVLVLLAALMVLFIYKGARRALGGATFGAYVGGLIVVGHLALELLNRSLGGFTLGPNGEVEPDTILFLQQARPFNNVFLMVILIWIQTGFAMVILSAAIRAVPPELIEAAEVDGATESQSFFQVVLPQILPTIGVVTTTLIVLVSKVFDIVKVGTGGNFGTNVLANDMFEVSFSFGNFPLGSAIAVFILLSVLPVMYLNVRRMQQARA